MNKILKNTIILTVITLVSGLGLGMVYEVTKEPIAKAQETAKQEAYRQVLPDAESFEEVDVDAKAAAKAIKDAGIEGAQVNEAAEAVKGGETIGYVVTTTDSNGYGGDIQVSVGILNDGTVNGVAILSISETAGLGMKAAEESFYGQYEGKQTSKFEVIKDGVTDGEPIEAISGATITTRSVTGAVNSALAYYADVLGGGTNE